MISRSEFYAAVQDHPYAFQFSPNYTMSTLCFLFGKTDGFYCTDGEEEVLPIVKNIDDFKKEFEQYYAGKPPPKLSYPRGVIVCLPGPRAFAEGSGDDNEPEYADPDKDAVKEYLSTKPIGTFIIYDRFCVYLGDCMCPKVLVNTGEIAEEKVQINCESLHASCVEELKKKYEFELNRCNSILDVSFLRDLSPKDRQRFYNPELFIDVDCIVFLTPPHRQTDSYRDCIQIYFDILILLAKLDRIDMNIIIDKDYIVSKATINYKEIFSQIQGQAWVIGHFIELFFPLTKQMATLKPLKENTFLQKFYGARDPDTRLILPESKEEIPVHKFALSMCSKWCEKNIYGEMKSQLLFEGHPDAIVRRFIQVAYGFLPDFSDCEFIDLIKFACFVQSESLLKHCNILFNEEFDLDEEFVQTMIENDWWHQFPEKSFFFKCVVKLWPKMLLSDEKKLGLALGWIKYQTDTTGMIKV